MSGGASSAGRRTAALVGAGLLLGATSISLALCLRRRRAEDAQAPQPAGNGAAQHGREIAARVREEALKKEEDKKDTAMAEASTDVEEEDRAAEADIDAPESVSSSTGLAEDMAELAEPAVVSEAVGAQEHAATTKECAMETEVAARSKDVAGAEPAAAVVAEDATPKGAAGFAEATPTSAAAEERIDAARESASEASDGTDEAGRDGGEEDHAAASGARPKSEEAVGTLKEATVSEEIADSAMAEALADAVVEEAAALADSSREAAPERVAHSAGPAKDTVAAEPAAASEAAIVHEQAAEVAAKQANVGASSADGAICDQKAEELPAAHVDAADVQVAAEVGVGEVAFVSKDKGLDVDAEASAATIARLAGRVVFAEEVEVLGDSPEEDSRDSQPNPAQDSAESAESDAEDATGMEVATTPSGVERKRKRDVVKRMARRFISGLSRRWLRGCLRPHFAVGPAGGQLRLSVSASIG